MKIRTIIILLTIGLLLFAGCDNRQEETEEPNIIESMANALEHLIDSQSETNEKIATFNENTSQRLIDLEEKVNDLEERIKILEGK